MDFFTEIKNYKPKNEQETQDQKVIVSYMESFPHNVLLRENEIAHITASGFILNKTLDKVLFIHHNIRNTWAWTGGHADGDTDLPEVAAREAFEETSARVTPISREIASLDIGAVTAHTKNGKYINSHLHLSVAYLFTADENDPLIVKPDENSGVEWFPVDKINTDLFTERDVYLYKKLIDQAKAWTGKGEE
ncbi:MAG: NUDIX hydrolase [Defluviitaleaceae bacterium]|nr:NUDIX hydrolase [Defluviitaleaceae bacterium]